MNQKQHRRAASAARGVPKRIALLGLTRRHLAERIERDYFSVRKWFTGQQDPSIESLIRIAVTQGVDLNWLLLGKGEAPPTAEPPKKSRRTP